MRHNPVRMDQGISLLHLFISISLKNMILRKDNISLLEIFLWNFFDPTRCFFFLNSFFHSLSALIFKCLTNDRIYIVKFLLQIKLASLQILSTDFLWHVLEINCTDPFVTFWGDAKIYQWKIYLHPLNHLIFTSLDIFLLQTFLT